MAVTFAAVENRDGGRNLVQRADMGFDLARVIGDAPARAVASVVGRAVQALRSFVGARVPGGQAPAPAAGELPDRSPP